MTSLTPRLTLCLLGATLAVTATAQVSNFDTLNGYATAAESHLAQARNQVLRIADFGSASNIQVVANYVSRDVDAAKDSIERKTRTENVLVGYTWKQTNWYAGLGLGYDYTKSDYNEVRSPAPVPLHGKVTADTTELAAWAGVNTGWVQLAFSGTLGSTDNEGKRISDAGTSRGDYKSKSSSFAFRVSHNMSFESVVLDPFVGVSFASADVDGFAEQGIAPDRRILRDYDLKENRFAFGARISGKSGDWVPSATVAYLTRMSGGDTGISNTASNGSNLGIGVVPESSNGLFYVAAGLTGKIDDHWSVSGLVDYTAGGDEKQFGVNLRVSRSF